VLGTPGLAFILWTGSRGPLLAVIVVTLCCFALFWNERRSIALYAFISIGLAIAIASLLPLPNPIYGVWQAFGLADVKSETLNAASSGRLETWKYTFEEALKRPFFGWGVNQYNHFLPDAREQLFHPHNYPVQLLFASGFGGAALLLVAVLAFVLPRLRTITSDGQKFNGAFALTLLFYSLYDGILYFAYPMMIFTLVFIGCLQPPPAPDRSN
jgi:O-antigen ligase